jgi:hypothetical protein
MISFIFGRLLALMVEYLFVELGVSRFKIKVTGEKKNLNISAHTAIISKLMSFMFDTNMSREVLP